MGSATCRGAGRGATLVLAIGLVLGLGFGPGSVGDAVAQADGRPAPTTREGFRRRAPTVDLLRPAPLVLDRLRPSDIGLVINRRDPYSVAVGAYYARRRGLRADQVLTLDLPTGPQLTAEAFGTLQAAIDTFFGYRVQALALAWTAPYAVGCQSINGALALGLDASLCAQSCAPSTPSPYANARSARPFTELRFRPSMLLAAPSVDEARSLIDRGVAADGSLAGVANDGAPAEAGAAPLVAEVAWVHSSDAARNVRGVLQTGLPERLGGLAVRRVETLGALAGRHLVMVSAGQARLDGLPAIDWAPGALADHLTSLGGDLEGAHGQATALAWITAGATASHGTVSEPCNHLHKFPNPRWLLLHYVQGATAIEAYWKSVAWPSQSLFIGEPLAAPFAAVPRRPTPQVPAAP